MLPPLTPLLALPLLSLLLPTTAFDLHMYTSKQCTGMATTSETKVENGCSTFRAGSVSGIINRWASEEDNKLLLATYSDSTCCHANLIETIEWQPNCLEIKSGVQSWRIVDPEDPDKGKEGDDYTC